MKTLDTPRTINPAITFNALVQWFHDEMIVRQKAPGFLIGLSGTDSLVTFLAAYKAFEKAGKPHRVMGVHFAPSEDFLYDHPEAEEHTWFRDQVIPWLSKQCPKAEVVIDTSIDWRCDGLRWGALMDLSVVSNLKRRTMRPVEDQYWLVGTRNLTEEMLLNYSNTSTIASVQPLVHFWKSEILQISEYLGVPQVAIAKSCETDCICGRLRLPAQHIPEVDMLLMVGRGDLSVEYAEKNIPADLSVQLNKFIRSQINKNVFKKFIPYEPNPSIIQWNNDPLVVAFEEGTLNLKEFNHRQHLYVAWCYLKDVPLETAVSIYAHFLESLLESAGYTNKFSLPVTRAYFEKLDAAMKRQPMANFDELLEKEPSLLKKQQNSA